VASLLVELWNLSWNHNSLKSLYIIIHKKFEAGHRLHITENIVGVPKMFYLKRNVWKIYPKPVVPNLFVTADRSMHDNFTAAREYSMVVALFQQSKWSYQYEPLDKAATVQSAAFLYLQHSHFMLQYSHSVHPAVLPRENGQITCPDTCPFERGAMGRMCLFTIVS